MNATGSTGSPHPGNGALRRFVDGMGVKMAGRLVVVAAALVAIGWALYHNLAAIDRIVARLVEVDEPLQTAAHEMEINVLGCGLGTWKYLGTGAREHRDRVAKDRADFQGSMRDYRRLATTAPERDLAARLEAHWAPYSELCETLMVARDDYSALLRRVTESLDEIDRIVDEQIQPSVDVGAAEGWPKLLASTAIEADVAEVGAAVGAYVADPSERHRDLVLAARREASDRVNEFLDLTLAPDERRHGTRVQRLLVEAAGHIEQGMVANDALRGHASTFATLRNHIDNLLDEGIQMLAREDLAGAGPRARAAIDRLHALNLFFVALGALVCFGAICLLAYQSTQLQAANRGLRAEAAVRHESESARTRLFAQLVSAQEQERGRLARELHDQMGQDLSALKLGLRALARANDAGGTAEQLGQLQTLTSRLIDQVHDIAWELRPAALDDSGIHGVLANHVETWTRVSGVRADIESNLEGRRLPASLEIALYRIAQEALTNVAKHARAKNVSLTLQQLGNEVVMVVEDDGRGFDGDAIRPASGARDRLGLPGMQERATLAGGTFRCESAPGAGTTIAVRVPVPAST